MLLVLGRRGSLEDSNLQLSGEVRHRDRLDERVVVQPHRGASLEVEPVKEVTRGPGGLELLPVAIAIFPCGHAGSEGGIGGGSWAKVGLGRLRGGAAPLHR